MKNINLENSENDYLIETNKRKMRIPDIKVVIEVVCGGSWSAFKTSILNNNFLFC